MIRIHEEFATQAEAEAFRDRYYINYNPCGYGTRIDIKLVDGKWIAAGSRYDSCD